MSRITFTCHSCNQVLKVGADKAGRKAKCVKCGTMLTIPAASGQERLTAAVTPAPSAPPPPAKRGDDADDRRHGRGWNDSWPKVRLGSFWALIGLCIYSGGYALHVLAMFFLTMNSIGSSLPSAGVARTIEDISGISILIREAGLIAAVVGFVFWLFVSNHQRKLAFAIATLAVSVLLLIFQVIPLFEDRFTPIAVLIMIAFLLPAMFMMMFFYTRGVGKSLEDESLAGRSLMGIIVAGVVAGYLVIVPIVLHLMGQSNRPQTLSLILTWLGIAISIALQVFAIINVKATHSAADR